MVPIMFPFFKFGLEKKVSQNGLIYLRQYAQSNTKFEIFFVFSYEANIKYFM